MRAFPGTAAHRPHDPKPDDAFHKPVAPATGYRPPALSRVRADEIAAYGALLAAFAFVGIAHPLQNLNEGLYARIAQEMLEQGTWVVPTLNGVPYLEKPPLLYWLTRLAFAALVHAITAGRDGIARMLRANVDALGTCSSLPSPRHGTCSRWDASRGSHGSTS